jgi:glutathione-regulated potassium-efflux system ancillary protein KefG
MTKILLIFAHPLLERSRINRALIQEARNIDGVLVHDLYEEYPEFLIDIQREQQLLLEHDIIIWQHPFYWYSCPPLLKQWIDVVLEIGWAYGPGGTQLQHKKLLQCISTGGSSEAYSKEGTHGFEVMDFLLPFRKTASLCKMNYLPPFTVHGSHRISNEDLSEHVFLYKSMLNLLMNVKISEEHYKDANCFNHVIKKMLNER